MRILDVAAALGRVGQHLFLRVVRHRAEVGERADIEVHRAAGLVGVAAVEHHADEAADVGDGGRGSGLAPTRQEVQRGHVVVEARRLRRGQVEIVHAERAGLGQDRVVDVGDVAHALRVVADVAQASLQDVVRHVDGGVPEVGRVVGRDAARVHRDDGPGSNGNDGLPSRVVQPHLHQSPSGMPVNFTATLVL